MELSAIELEDIAGLGTSRSGFNSGCVLYIRVEIQSKQSDLCIQRGVAWMRSRQPST